MKHLACLRLLIVSLKASILSEQISNVVLSECVADYLWFKNHEELQKMYSESWKSFENEKQKQELKEMLPKVDLGLVDDFIKPVDHVLWKYWWLNVHSFEYHVVYI